MPSTHAMRIGINTLFLIPGEVGGSETYLRETLLAMMAEFPATAWCLFTNRENHRYFGHLLRGKNGWQSEPLDFAATNRYARIVREQLQLPIRLRASGLDLLWSPGYTAPLWAPCPQVVSILDMQYKAHPEDLSLIARLTTDLLVKIGARRCRKILAISEFSRREIVRYIPGAQHKVYVTHLAAAEKWSLSPPATIGLIETLLGDNKPYLLCVANSYPHKNLHRLVQAFALIEPRIAHRLVIVGKARLGEQALLREIGRLAEPRRVVRLTGLDSEALRQLYQQAALFVFPSLYEGFGLPVLEAMLSGTPVLTTSRGSLPEVGGAHVRYVDGLRSDRLASAMLEMLGWSEQQRRNWTRQAKSWGQRQFTWQRTAQATMRCFQNALGVQA